MYPFQMASELQPRHELTDEGVITNRLVPGEKLRTFSELKNTYNKDADLSYLDEFSREVGRLIDVLLIEDTLESNQTIKDIVTAAKDWKLTVYVGTQIHHLLTANPKLVSDPEDVGHFKKYRDHLILLGKEKKLITSITERFL